MQDLALKTAREEIKIFPANPLNKKPYSGFKDWANQATTDLEIIQQWWTVWPDALIAAPTGNVNGFFVFDIDVSDEKQGLENLEKLEKVYGPLPVTLAVRTPTGGLHFYFTMPEGMDIRNSQSQIAPHIDIRGNGGYIIWPGSIRPQGEYSVVSDWRTQ